MYEGVGWGVQGTHTRGYSNISLGLTFFGTKEGNGHPQLPCDALLPSPASHILKDLLSRGRPRLDAHDVPRPTSPAQPPPPGSSCLGSIRASALPSVSMTVTPRFPIYFYKLLGGLWSLSPFHFLPVPPPPPLRTRRPGICVPLTVNIPAHLVSQGPLPPTTLRDRPGKFRVTIIVHRAARVSEREMTGGDTAVRGGVRTRAPAFLFRPQGRPGQARGPGVVCVSDHSLPRACHRASWGISSPLLLGASSSFW